MAMLYIPSGLNDEVRMRCVAQVLLSNQISQNVKKNS